MCGPIPGESRLVIAGGVCMHVEKCIRYQRVQLLFEKKTLLHIIFNPQQLLSEKKTTRLWLE